MAPHVFLLVKHVNLVKKKSPSFQRDSIIGKYKRMRHYKYDLLTRNSLKVRRPIPI